MYNKTILPNGIRLLTEEIPNLFSVSIGIWVNSGSRNESLTENGISHFLEHLFFKGTERRSAQDIAKEIDSIGGILNAFTSREYTCYYSKVLGEYLPIAIDLLLDIIQNSKFDSIELEKERNVILQEIKMVEDTPDEYIHDIFYQSMYNNHPLGYPILGTNETIERITRDDIISFINRKYSPQQIIISSAGSLKHDDVIKHIERIGFNIKGDIKKSNSSVINGPSKFKIINKKLEQVHICLGVRGINYSHSQRYAFYLMNTIFGGGMSSRLFQEVREKRGLVYTIYSFISSFSDTGFLGVYFGTESKNVNETIKLISEEFNNLKEKLIPQEELKSAKNQLKGHLLLSTESSDNRMSRLAKNELYFGRFFPMEEIIEGIESVNPEDIKNIANSILKDENFSLALLGAYDEKDLPKQII